jgi:flagellin
MSLVINHNMMAMNTARNLGLIYGRLAKSTERLSTGLRINNAADDAAGLAIRELMRADIKVMNQGIRNAHDGISMIQTAEGAMAVIDEKLTRMKELAEQAATGTYTTVQREIINSEYQAMAAEIDRIANATDFNGIKLLDGSISDLHGGSGLKVHFGTGNDPDEDYYFVKMDDVRATEGSGLRIGGDAKNDIWGQGGVSSTGEITGCCGLAGINDLDDPISGVSGQAFGYSYNYVADSNVEPNGSGLCSHPSFLAGVYQMESGDSLRDLINSVNEGTQSRVKIELASATGTLGDLNLSSASTNALNICLGDEVYQFGSGGTALSDPGDKALFHRVDSDASAAVQFGSALANAINNCSLSFWALQSGDGVYVFHKDGGDNDGIYACDTGLGSAGLSAAAAAVNWQNMETYTTFSGGTTFANGGEDWATMFGVKQGDQWGIKLSGRDVGEYHDLRVCEIGSAGSSDFLRMGNGQITGFAPTDFAELQNAEDGPWHGAHLRTQSHAQEALDAIGEAINRKDKVRASLGAFQNRLENTITNLGIMAENLQASESRISDVDVATEMTEFTKNNIMAQAATSMLSQANSLPQLALSLLG